MTENPLLILIVGISIALLCLFSWHVLRWHSVLYLACASLLATAALFGIERFIQTDEEQINSAIYRLASLFEDNDIDGVLAFVDPHMGTGNTKLRLEYIEFERVRVLDTEIEIDGDVAWVIVHLDYVIKHHRSGKVPDGQQVSTYAYYGLRDDGAQWTITAIGYGGVSPPISIEAVREGIVRHRVKEVVSKFLALLGQNDDACLSLIHPAGNASDEVEELLSRFEFDAIGAGRVIRVTTDGRESSREAQANMPVEHAIRHDLAGTIDPGNRVTTYVSYDMQREGKQWQIRHISGTTIDAPEEGLTPELESIRDRWLSLKSYELLVTFLELLGGNDRQALEYVHGDAHTQIGALLGRIEFQSAGYGLHRLESISPDQISVNVKAEYVIQNDQDGQLESGQRVTPISSYDMQFDGRVWRISRISGGSIDNPEDGLTPTLKRFRDLAEPIGR